MNVQIPFTIQRDQIRVAVLGFFVIALAGCAHRNPMTTESETDAPWRPLIVEFETKIPKLMAEAVVPGLSIAVIYNAKIVWRCGFGVADSVTKVPVDHETIFQAGSMSKPVFAYVALKLCEVGSSRVDLQACKLEYSIVSPK